VSTTEQQREAARLRAAAWRRANPERARALSAVSQARRKQKWAEFLAAERERYQDRRDKVLARQKERREREPEAIREIRRRHYLKYPERATANCALRRATKAQATPEWVDKCAIRAVFEAARLMTLKTGVPHEVDHIAPLRGRGVCGLHVPWNLQIIPREVNRRKHNKMPDGGC